jgi:hypothetical protein
MLSPPRASIRIVPVSSIDVRGWDEIWRLTSRFYAADRSYVERRLKAVQHLALLRARPGRQLVGMAAIEEDLLTFEGRRTVVTFTSHTVLDPRYRGQNLLQRVGLRRMLRTWLDHPLKRKVWAFDSGSARGYLLLPRNWPVFWPRHDVPTPGWEARFMSEYGSRKYGSSWQGDGIVQRVPQKRLLPLAGPLHGVVLSDPHVQYFLQRNPGHAEGDTLFCMVPLTLGNCWGLLRNMLARWLRGGRQG